MASVKQEKIELGLNVDAAKIAILHKRGMPKTVAPKGDVNKLIGSEPYTDPTKFDPDTDVIAPDLEGNQHRVVFGRKN